MRLCSVFLFLWFLLCSSLTGNPFFDGSVRYQFSSNNSQVTLSYSKISNSQLEYRTGTIKVSLWACEEPYHGGRIWGTRVADFKLDGLGAGQFWHSGSKTINATLPEYPEYYYMVMTVEEYVSDGYVISDWIAFDEMAYLSRPAPPAPKPLLQFSGPFSWQTYPSRGSLEIKSGKISHSRNGKTGTLRLSIWATRQPYKGGGINGWILGYARKEALREGMIYPSSNHVVDYQAPPPGNYYVTIALQEYDGRDYKIMDYHTFDGTFTFN